MIQAEVTDVAGRVSDRLSGFAGLSVIVNGQPAEVDIACVGVPLDRGVPFEELPRS